MKKVILFSPRGYIGGFLKRRLEEEKDIQLYEIERGTDFRKWKGNYDVFVYSASVSNASVKKFVQDNVVTALAVMDFCEEHHVKRVIYLSSDSVYGEVNWDVVTEMSIMKNPGIYGATKYLAEKIIMEGKVPYYILRMPGVVGRGWRECFICRLMDKIQGNEHIRLYNIGRQFNNILDIDDLTEFVVRLCNIAEGKSEVFLLGNTEKVLLGEIVSYLKGMYHSDSEVTSVDTNEKRYFTLDVTKAVEYGYSSNSIKVILDELAKIQGDRKGQA